MSTLSLNTVYSNSSISSIESEEASSLERAMQDENEQEALELIANPYIDVRSPGSHGWTPLEIAIADGSEPLIKALLKRREVEVTVDCLEIARELELGRETRAHILRLLATSAPTLDNPTLTEKNVAKLTSKTY